MRLRLQVHSDRACKIHGDRGKIIMGAPISQRADRRYGGFLYELRLRMMKLLNVFLVALPFELCWVGYYARRVVLFPSPYRDVAMLVLFVALYSFFGRTYDAFLISIKRISEMFFSQALGILMADMLMFLMLWMMSSSFPNLLPALLALSCQLLLSAAWCRLAHQWYFSRFAGQRAGIVYDARRGMEDLFSRYGLDKKFDIKFTCSVEECLAQRMKMLSDLDSVFLCGVHSHDRNMILKYCVAQGINVYMLPRVGDVIMSGAKRMHMFHLPILRAGRYNPPIEYTIMKRAFDIVISVLAIVVTSPLMLGVSIAIKAYDGGPVLYKQTRLTKDGKEFKILKFRSMRVDAEKDGVARLSTGENDDRITPVGRFIRACRLDELPQLFNILGGSMSVVGPRPERPEIAAQYEKEMPEFALRLQAKAGLTGYAQVYGKYNTIPYDKLQMDLMYIANPSVLEDLRIIFATVQVLFQKESTEGVGPGQTTAVVADNVENAEKSA